MQGLGFTDEVSDEDVHSIAEEAQQRCASLPPLERTLGPVDPDAEGISLLVTPWDQVEQLRNRIREAVGSVWNKHTADKRLHHVVAQANVA